MNVRATQKKRRRKEGRRRKEREMMREKRKRERKSLKLALFILHYKCGFLKNVTIYITEDLNKHKHHNQHKTATNELELDSYQSFPLSFSLFFDLLIISLCAGKSVT